MFLSKWWSKNESSFRKNSHVTKIKKKKKRKTLSQRNFSIKFGSKYIRYEYIYILKYNFKNVFCLKMAAKTSFVTLCNNANLC